MALAPPLSEWDGKTQGGSSDAYTERSLTAKGRTGEQEPHTECPSGGLSKHIIPMPVSNNPYEVTNNGGVYSVARKPQESPNAGPVRLVV